MNVTADRPRFKAIIIEQGAHTLYQFRMTAEDLAVWAKIERFGEAAEGVNRKFNLQHAEEMAFAMLEPDTIMADSIQGDLRGEWEVIDGELVGSPESYLAIDDGQHRHWVATEFQGDESLKRWHWPVVATMGLPYHVRLKVFLQQDKGKPIDSRLSLAMRYELTREAMRTGGKPPMSEVEREAYELVLALNGEKSSPLRDLIILDEQDKRPYEGRHRPKGINATGLWQAIKALLSKGSPIHNLPVNSRVEVVRNMIWAASEVWPAAWRSKEHVLTTAKGLNAVLKLMTKQGSEFRVVIGTNWTYDNLAHALSYAKKYRWHVKDNKGISEREITEALDKAIGNGFRRDKTVQLAS
jgi:hypothetical protein